MRSDLCLGRGLGGGRWQGAGSCLFLPSLEVGLGGTWKAPGKPHSQRGRHIPLGQSEYYVRPPCPACPQAVGARQKGPHPGGKRASRAVLPAHCGSSPAPSLLLPPHPPFSPLPRLSLSRPFLCISESQPLFLHLRCFFPLSPFSHHCLHLPPPPSPRCHPGPVSLAPLPLSSWAVAPALSLLPVSEVGVGIPREHPWSRGSGGTSPRGCVCVHQGPFLA